MPHCRCRTCGHRRTLTTYQFANRPPKCVCGRRVWRHDRYRDAVEIKRRPCRCPEYSFPHRWASGYCIHNHKITADDMRLRYESRNWA